MLFVPRPPSSVSPFSQLRPLGLLLTALLAIAAPLSAAIGTWNGSWPPPAGSYNTGNDANVPVSAVVQESPQQITLTLHRAGAYTIYRKLRDETSWGTALVTLPAGSTSYVDTAVTAGVAYEYRLVLTRTPQSAASGYVIAGIRVDQTAPRGRVVLVVTTAIANGLPAELDAYQRDLGADGWTVHTLTVTPGNYGGTGNLHQSIRADIQTLNTAYPGELKNVILLGRVPVPRSGLIDGGRPDGHYSSFAEATDSYYAEMDGNWNDTGTNIQYSTSSNFFQNIAGDGLFDASTVSALGTGQKIDLGFGRIDLSYGQTSEIATTRMYLQKLARYRRAANDFQPGRRGVIRKGYDNVDEAGWMSLPSLLGAGNIVAVTSTADLPANPTGRYDTDGLFTRENQQGPFLFYFKGTGMLDDRDDDSRAVFWSGMQSHWGFWADSGGGKMPARLAADSFTLSFTWSIWGIRHLYHRLGLGGDMGDMLRTTINNSSSFSGFYPYVTGGTTNGDKNGRLWISHMGDPTLRLFPVRPPVNLAASPSGASDVSLSWTGSDDTGLLGVHVYRAPAPTGPWTRLTTAGSPLLGNTYTDTPPTPGDWTYSVRAVKLETTPCGTYLNPSLGATVTAQTETASTPLAITTTTLPAAAWQTKGSITLQATGGNQPYTWSLVGGTLPTGMTLSSDGTISGTPARGGETFQPVFQVSDFRGATAQIGYELGVTTRRTLSIPVIADTMAKSSVSFVDYNYGTSNGLAVVKSAYTAPLYTDSIAFLRFSLPALAEGERLDAARLCLTMGSGSATTTTTTLTASLLADSMDNWVEGILSGWSSTGSSLTYTNRPTSLNATVPAVTLLGALAPNARISMNILSHCAATLANDPARIASWIIGSNTISSLTICSRENPPAVHPVVELEITHAPLITLARPLSGSATIPSGQGIVLSSVVTDSSAVTNAWSTISGPGVVTFENTGSASTTAGFSAPGRYSLLLTSDDGELVTQQLVDVRVVSTASTIRTDNLVLYYRFNESGGATASDSAPDGVPHPAALGNTTGLLWSPSGGRSSGALNFSTNLLSLQTPDEAALDNTNRLSVALWLNPAAATLDANPRGLLSKRVFYNDQDAYSVYTQNGLVCARFNGGNFTVSTTTAVLTAGKWTHLAVVYDGTLAGTANCVKIYVNGVAVPVTGGNETDASIPNTTASLWIGQLGGNTSYTFQGLMDELRLYRGRALGASDVAELMASEAPRLTIAAPVDAPVSGEPFALTATLTDAGLPLSSDSVTLQWSKPAGTPVVAFSTPAALSTAATATGDGSITLRLAADDGAVGTFVDTTLAITAATLNYAAWSAQITWPVGADSTATGDPDGDGFSNLLEYALAFDPLSADSATHRPSVSIVDGHLAFSFTRDSALSTLTYEVQASPDLSPNSWITLARSTAGTATTSVNSGALSINETTTGDLRRVTIVDATALSGVSRRFLRLLVTQP
ncbi:MAG: LamG-like jellyroll fold domain-containing protein [Opitutaceae bacterium]|jgi:hypothetical protein